MLHALSEYKIYNKISAIAGTSIGALNMALIKTLSTNKAMDIWTNEISKILFTNNINVSEVMCLLRKVNSKIPPDKPYLKDRMGLVNYLKSIDIGNLSYSNSTMFATCVNVTNNTSSRISAKAANAWVNDKIYGKAEYLTLNNKSEEDIIKILLASSAIPLIYQPVEIHDKFYVDGGLADNLPIYPLHDIGCRHLIIIPISTNFSVQQYVQKYPDTLLYFFKPSRNLGNIFSGTLNFSKDKIEYMIHLGYTDGMNYIAKYNFD